MSDFSKLAGQGGFELAAVFDKLLSLWHASDRLFRLTTTLGPDVLIVEKVEGIESVFGAPLPDAAKHLLPKANDLPAGSLVAAQHTLPQPALGELPQNLPTHSAGDPSLLCGYRFELTVLSTTVHIDLDRLLGTPLLLEMQTALSRSRLRPIHGYVTQARYIGSNGGLSRYAISVEPWLAFLRLKRDSWVFQDQAVPDILETVFADYGNQGKLVSDFRFELKDRGVYPRRSLITQYQETDWHFVSRLMQSEGLFGWFEHEGDASASGLGRHTLVISDRDGFDEACTRNPASPIRFHRADATEKGDSFQQWLEKISQTPTQVKLTSYDYRTLAPQTVTRGDGGSGPRRRIADVVSHYAWVNQADGERRAENLLAAYAAKGRYILASGTERNLAPGQVFELAQHERHPGAARFRTLAVVHTGRNNVSADMKNLLTQAFSGDKASEEAADDFYRNQAVVQFAGAELGFGDPIDTPYAPIIDRFHAKPTVVGTQTAIVVGAAGSPIDTDRNHRVKVQFHWQRGAGAHNRLTPPTGDDNAPANEQSSTWVRVGTPLAGGNFGAVMLPRVGQEVVIAFLDGDIDRPAVVGAVYNGEGQKDAQHNQAQGQDGQITGNAPAWFAGESGNHGHADSLIGIKTQALSNSQTGLGGFGSGGFSQLVFDDTPKQSRLELSTTQAAAQLQMGHLRHTLDNERREGRGHGLSLESKAAGAVRAGQGLLLTSHARPGAGGAHLEANEAQAILDAHHEAQASLIDSAKQHQADLPNEPKPGELPIEKSLESLKEALAVTEDGTELGGDGEQGFGGGAGQVPAWSEPNLLLSSPSGQAWLTPGRMSLSSREHTTIISQDITLGTQATFSIVTPAGLRLFSYGKKPAGSKPEQSQGITLHAAAGKTVLQAQKDKANLNAQKSVTISSNDKVTIASPTTLKLVANGAGLELKGGNITITCPKAALFKAASKSQTGPASASRSHPEFTTSQYGPHAKQFLFTDLDGKGIAGAKVELYDPETKTKLWQGDTTESGTSAPTEREGFQAFTALVGFDDWSSSFSDLDEPKSENDVDDVRYESDEDDRENEY